MKKIMNIRIWLLVLAWARFCLGEEGKVNNMETFVSKMTIVANETKLSADKVEAELQVFSRQPLSQESIKFSAALSNHSNKKLVLSVNALLDALSISLKYKGDPSITLPNNVRFLINSPVLPPRPYEIVGWRIATEVTDGTITTVKLPNTTLQSNDPKVLREATVEIPAMSELILDIRVSTLVKASQMKQKTKTNEIGIQEGEYSLEASILLFFINNNTDKNYMRFKTEKPVTITVYDDLGDR